MAVSGSQLTRIGAYFAGVAKKLIILAKSVTALTPSLIVTTNIQQIYSTNIDLPIVTSNKKVSYTNELGG